MGGGHSTTQFIASSSCQLGELPRNSPGGSKQSRDTSWCDAADSGGKDGGNPQSWESQGQAVAAPRLVPSSHWVVPMSQQHSPTSASPRVLLQLLQLWSLHASPALPAVGSSPTVSLLQVGTHGPVTPELWEGNGCPWAQAGQSTGTQLLLCFLGRCDRGKPAPNPPCRFASLCDHKKPFLLALFTGLLPKPPQILFQHEY